jgi:hypothetical protein
MNARFPLTLTLSLGERGQRLRVSDFLRGILANPAFQFFSGEVKLTHTNVPGRRPALR